LKFVADFEDDKEKALAAEIAHYQGLKEILDGEWRKKREKKKEKRKNTFLIILTIILPNHNIIPPRVTQ